MAQLRNSLKFGWLPGRFGWPLRIAVAAAILVPSVSAAQSARIIFAGGNWAAIDFGERCEARSRALRAKKGTGPLAGFAFGRAGTGQGQFYVRLSRPARAGATVMARIGATPFLLAGKGQWAWSRNAAQQHSMLEAARYGESLRVESRDTRGRRIVDRYALDGAATAIDAAAAACAGNRG